MDTIRACRPSLPIIDDYHPLAWSKKAVACTIDHENPGKNTRPRTVIATPTPSLFTREQVFAAYGITFPASIRIGPTLASSTTYVAPYHPFSPHPLALSEDASFIIRGSKWFFGGEGRPLFTTKTHVRAVAVNPTETTTGGGSSDAQGSPPSPAKTADQIRRPPFRCHSHAYSTGRSSGGLSSSCSSNGIMAMPIAAPSEQLKLVACVRMLQYLV